MIHRFRLGALQLAGLEIYVLDPAHRDALPFPGLLLVEPGTSPVLEVDADQLDIAWAWITEGANSADASADRPLCRALSALASRVLAAPAKRACASDSSEIA